VSTPLLTDTIVAIATAPGRSALAVVRISGPAAVRILGAITPHAPTPPADRVQTLLAIHDPLEGELIDRALVTVFRRPRSFTGEDSVEITTHGGALTPTLVVGAAIAAGARQALAGEFTRRAYLNGKLDLVQAEAVADLIEGTSPAFRRAALHQMERGLSRRLESLRSAILRVEALGAYSIDFPDEDEPPVPLPAIVSAARQVAEEIGGILRTAPEGRALRDGALTVLAGLPNSGKSSLFNALLGTERAIVTEVPGTTRDAIEAHTTIEGYPFRLVDTAGLRSTTDRVEAIGIEISHRYAAAADIVLFCSVAGGPLTMEEERFLAQQRERSPVVLLRTMADLYGDAEEREGAVAVSVETGAGLDLLRHRLVHQGFPTVHASDVLPVVTRERHTRALTIAHEEIERYVGAIEDGIPLEFASTHLRQAAAHIEEIIGVVTADDVLGAVFGTFCIGK
jgi:tRNA modification GTPase